MPTYTTSHAYFRDHAKTTELGKDDLEAAGTLLELMCRAYRHGNAALLEGAYLLLYPSRRYLSHNDRTRLDQRRHIMREQAHYLLQGLSRITLPHGTIDIKPKQFLSQRRETAH